MKMGLRVLAVLVVGGLLVAGVIAQKGAARERMKSRALSDFQAKVRLWEMDGEVKESAARACATVHEAAWEGAFTAEDVTGGTFNESAYERAMWKGLIEWAKPGGNQALLERLEAELVNVGDRGNAGGAGGGGG